MAVEIPVLVKSFVAGEDLSAKQFFFVELNATTGSVELCDAATDIPIGILQNSPESGETADVMIVGITKVSASGALAVGTILSTDAAGQGVAAIATTYPVARVISLPASTAASGLVTCTINCLNPVVF